MRLPSIQTLKICMLIIYLENMKIGEKGINFIVFNLKNIVKLDVGNN
jgi:hypothetical protein